MARETFVATLMKENEEKNVLQKNLLVVANVL